MEDFSGSVMLALLPDSSEWCKIELPHLTLVDVGEIVNLSPTAHNELAKIAIDFAMTCQPLTLTVTGPDVFGEADKVDVLRLETSPQLLAMRALVEDWNDSQHPFNPHVTVGPKGSIEFHDIQIPETITFSKIAVGWGDSLLRYKFLLTDH